MFPVKHLSSKILIAVSYCGRQLARRLGRAAPASHRKGGAALHPGACKHSLQYDSRPDGRFVVRVGTWSVGSLCGKGVERFVRN